MTANAEAFVGQLRDQITEKFGTPQSDDFIRVSVSIQPGTMVEDYTQALSLELLRIMKLRGLSEEGTFDAGMIRSYLITLVWLRVRWVNGTFPQQYKSIRKTVQVPLLWYALLLQIGEAMDKTYGIRFTPKMEIEDSDLLSSEEMRALSDRFYVMESLGFRVESGVPQDTTGELGFMVMSHIDNKIVSYREEHPVHAFLASFMVMEKLDKVVGVERVRYGYVDAYATAVRDLTVGRSAGSSP